MRVVAGRARGRRLLAPRGDAVRPTSDRTREAVFNALGSLDAVSGATVLDLFAGTGALGIEAASRGAASVTFVEVDRAAVDVVAANLAATGLSGEVVRAEALGWLAGTRGDYDLVLADPPYAFDEWDRLWDLVAARSVPGAVVVAESDRPVPIPAAWEELRRRRYGRAWVVIARPVSDGATG